MDEIIAEGILQYFLLVDPPYFRCVHLKLPNLNTEKQIKKKKVRFVPRVKLKWNKNSTAQHE